MISQAATILWFWIFLYPTEAMKIKSTKRSLCDIQNLCDCFLCWFCSLTHALRFLSDLHQCSQGSQAACQGNVNSFFSPSPTQTSLSHHTNFSLYFPYPVSTFLLLSDSWSPQCHLHKPDDKVPQISQGDTRHLQNKCSAWGFLFWLYQWIFNFH